MKRSFATGKDWSRHYINLCRLEYVMIYSVEKRKVEYTRGEDILIEVFKKIKGFSQKKIIFFGTGSYSEFLYGLLPCKVAYFIDNDFNKWNSIYKGVGVFSPEVLNQEKKDEVMIIIASQFCIQIADQLKSMGFDEGTHFWNGYSLTEIDHLISQRDNQVDTFYNKTIVSEEYCFICGKTAKFIIFDRAVLFREATCEYCGASIRNSDTAKIIVNKLLRKNVSLREAANDLQSFKILGTCSSGSIHSILRTLPGYIYGEYFNDVRPGEAKDGILCIDLTNLQFETGYFDLVITEDVFEHIDNSTLAFTEINRILKLGGQHIFTVPLHENRRTLDRKCLENKIFHGEHLVHTDFGQDIEQILDGFGMATERFILHKFYKDDEVTNTDLEFEKYRILKDRPFEYFKYNSIVFCSSKIKSIYNAIYQKGDEIKIEDYTGERYIPGMFGEIADEHLHRYYAISSLIKDKVVVDAACGEGYGSFILSQYAQHVYGFDIDKKSVLRARRRYSSTNLKYINASIEKLPLEDESVDVIISFETIEHVSVDVQVEFLKEVKRVLKKDGYLIISTPDKTNYSDKYNYNNCFHVKEFYYNEFQIFLNRWFSNVFLFNQGIESLSLISSANNSDNRYRFLRQPDSWKINKRYILAVCSNAEVPAREDILSFMYQDNFNYECNMARIQTLRDIVKSQSEQIKNQWRQIYDQRRIIGHYALAHIKEKKIVFFGTGSAVQKIYATFPLKAVYYVDNNHYKWGNDFENTKIYSPEQLIKEEKEQIAIIVASQYFKDIAQQLNAMGFEENVHYWNGYELYALDHSS